MPYQIFFERQFPLLNQEYCAPKLFSLRLGRRPRHILSETKRNGIVVSKTVDTSYKRFEVSFARQEETEDYFGIEIEAKGIEYTSPLFYHQGYLNLQEQGKVFYLYFDIKVDKKEPLCKITLKNLSQGSIIETKLFHLNDMDWENVIDSF